MTRNETIIKRKPKRPVWMIILEIVMLVLCFFMLMPFIFAVMTSLKSPAEAALLNFTLPTELHFENYLTAIERGNIGNAFVLSCIVTFSTVGLTVVISSMAAYVINRKINILTRFWYVFFVLGLIPPAFPIPTVKLMQVLGLEGNPLGLIFFYAAICIPFSVFLITGFLRGVPRELDEAAFIDGCSAWQVFWRVIFPTIKPVIFTNIIFVFMWVWNDFMWPLYILAGGANNSTLPLSVFEFVSQYSTKWHLVYADLVIVSLPVIVIYMVARKYIIEGMVAGAVKG